MRVRNVFIISLWLITCWFAVCSAQNPRAAIDDIPDVLPEGDRYVKARLPEYKILPDALSEQVMHLLQSYRKDGKVPNLEITFTEYGVPGFVSMQIIEHSGEIIGQRDFYWGYIDCDGMNVLIHNPSKWPMTDKLKHLFVRQDNSRMFTLNETYIMYDPHYDLYPLMPIDQYSLFYSDRYCPL